MLGAGLTDTYPNVIQLDLFYYPSVDIVTGGGDLPFQDGVLSGVICENVIEHLPNPFSLIKEIQHVLRPGGLLSLVGTNMYFTHGFPSHYFNPTRYGMQHLLEEVCHFEGIYETCDIAASLHSVVSHYCWNRRLERLSETCAYPIHSASSEPPGPHSGGFAGHIASVANAMSKPPSPGGSFRPSTLILPPRSPAEPVIACPTRCRTAVRMASGDCRGNYLSFFVRFTTQPSGFMGMVTEVPGSAASNRLA
jgi:predicted SAM-dependent methyltransferase